MFGGGEKMKPKKISPLQGVFFINQTQISIGILALPHLLMMKSGSSGWISILLTDCSSSLHSACI